MDPKPTSCALAIAPLVLACALARTATAQAPVFLGEPYAVGPFPDRLCFADFNGDGADDLAVANTGGSTVSILLARAVGGLQPPADFAVGLTPMALAAGDVNGDGRIDLAVPCWTVHVAILLGDGMGGFTAAAPVPLAPGSKVKDAALADFDHDGKLDLAVLFTDPKELRVFRGLGDGSFTQIGTHPIGATVPELPNRIRVGHLNGDNHLDLVVLLFGGPVAVLLGDGTGGFGAGTEQTAGAGNAFAIELGDWNHDGKLDLLSADVYTQTLSLQLGAGDGTFGSAMSAAIPGFPNGIAAGDANGDGHLDAVTANGPAKTVFLVLGDGATGLAVLPPIPVPANARQVAFGHVDHDDRLDLAIGFSFDDQVSIGYGSHSGTFGPNPDVKTAPSARAIATGDFDGNGLLDLAVLDEAGGNVLLHRASIAASTPSGDAIAYGLPLTYSVGTQPRALSIADFDHDGKLDFVTADAGSDTLTTLLLALPGAKAVFTTPAAGSTPASLACGDFDADGDVDVAVGYAGSTVVKIFANDGFGHLTAADTVNTGSPVPFLRAADFDHDGKVDLVAITDPPRLLTLRNLGGAWSMNGFASIQGTPIGLELANLNGDTAVDVVVALVNTGSFDAQAHLGSLGGGTYSLAPSAAFSTAGGVAGLAVGDLDRDGRVDVALVRASGSLGVWFGDGAGGFPASIDAPIGQNGNSAAAADLNGDGFVDVAVAHADGILTPLLNQTLQPTGIATYAKSSRGCQGILGIGATRAPKVGDAGFAFTCTQAPPFSLGLLVLADQALVPSQDLFYVKIDFHLDVFASSTLEAWDVYSDWGGYATLPTPIPNQPSLAGLTFFAQAFFAWSECPTASPFGLGSTNGLVLVIQP